MTTENNNISRREWQPVWTATCPSDVSMTRLLSASSTGRVPSSTTRNDITGFLSISSLSDTERTRANWQFHIKACNTGKKLSNITITVRRLRYIPTLNRLHEHHSELSNTKCKVQALKADRVLRIRLQSHQVHTTMLQYMQYEKKHKIQKHKHKGIYAQWNGPSVTKPNSENCMNHSSECAYDCAQLQYTIQHRTVPLISLLTSKQPS